MAPHPPSLIDRPSPARRRLRVIAWASNGIFGLSLLALTYGILQLTQDDLATALSPFDTGLTLVALTTASLVFPIALLSTLSLVRVPPTP